MSFRIYNNIPKTIITPQIKTLSIPFTIPDEDEEIGIVPVNICILAAKITLTTPPEDEDKDITLSFKDINNKQSVQTILEIPIEQTIGYNEGYIGPNGLGFKLFYIPTEQIPSQEAVIEFSYYQF